MVIFKCLRIVYQYVKRDVKRVRWHFFDGLNMTPPVDFFGEKPAGLGAGPSERCNKGEKE